MFGGSFVLQPENPNSIPVPIRDRARRVRARRTGGSRLRKSDGRALDPSQCLVANSFCISKFSARVVELTASEVERGASTKPESRHGELQRRQIAHSVGEPAQLVGWLTEELFDGLLARARIIDARIASRDVRADTDQIFTVANDRQPFTYLA